MEEGPVATAQALWLGWLPSYLRARLPPSSSVPGPDEPLMGCWHPQGCNSPGLRSVGSTPAPTPTGSRPPRGFRPVELLTPRAGLEAGAGPGRAGVPLGGAGPRILSAGSRRPAAAAARSRTPTSGSPRMGEFNEKKTTCGTVCLKYLLFTYNCCFWLAGLAVMAVGIWTLALKSDYISLLASGTYLATAYILVVAGAVVMVTGVLGCCATFKERRNLLRLYFILLLIIFLLEIIAGVLAYVYYQQLNTELKENLKDTMAKRYHQPGHQAVTSAVDQLQQEFHCCGSNNSQDWRDSEWIRSGEAGGRVVPDSCCKTVVAGCGQRDHASNIYKVEGGCITKLETFIQEHLRVIGAVGTGIACVQVFGMIFTCCLYRSLKLEHY
uniref:CD151 antigen n=6 Tax=Macaca TaxID=9539 RepID=A0A7N9CQ34_MACFA